MDPRETPSNGHVAHVSLKGKVEAERFVEGEIRRVWYGATDLRDAPNGNRLRQLNVGEEFRVLDMAKNHAFGIRLCDGYVGWASTAFLKGGELAPTHMVTAQRAPYSRSMNVKSTELPPVQMLSFGALVEARQHPNPAHQEMAAAEGWLLCIDRSGMIPESRYIKLSQVSPIGHPLTDPAAVAELFLHTPYLWGGNTAFGIDCSGLVQAALLACDTPCPGDSDQQEARVGNALPPDAPLRRNDLVFWKGHVAMALDPKTVIHANAHHMAVAIETLETARARIEATGGGPITSVRRP